MGRPKAGVARGTRCPSGAQLVRRRPALRAERRHARGLAPTRRRLLYLRAGPRRRPRGAGAPSMTVSRDDLERWDRDHVWHPFTDMGAYAAERPLIVAEARGCFLVDLDGREYLDGVSSLWCNVHGHRVPALDEAVREQLDAVAHTTLLGLSNVPAIRLARRLVELAPPGLSHVFYSDDGATAVEVALKMAFQYWRQRPDRRPAKTKFLALQGAYHGDTLGDVSVGDL